MIFLLMAACGHPKHLQSDFGESYAAAFTTQADLERVTVSQEAYPLSGMEALMIRYQTLIQAGDEESGESEISVKN